MYFYEPKKDRSLVIYVDCRTLDKLNIKSSYTLPCMDDILDQLWTAKIFTKIYRRSGYHMIRLSPDSIPLAVFNTSHGRFEFLVLPLGQSDSLTTFMDLMSSFFTPYLDTFVVIYPYDLLVYNDDE